MITKEQNYNKSCLFCASDYHLEMILLPYIKEKMKDSKIIIFTEDNLESSISTLLTKVNLSKEDIEKIRNINWSNDDIFKFKQIEKTESQKNVIIINGSNNYIKKINKKIEDISIKNLEIVECFHIDDQEIDLEKISKEYKTILNTQKI